MTFATYNEIHERISELNDCGCDVFQIKRTIKEEFGLKFPVTEIREVLKEVAESRTLAMRAYRSGC